jgi:FkbM family methyltransferase
MVSLIQIKTQIKNIVYEFIAPPYNQYKSFSQAGEDGIIKYVFSQLNIQTPNYLDIGTNHPYHGNNTFVFYKNGSQGVCIEANPELIPLIEKYRPNDICLNIGVGIEETEIELSIFEISGISTFSLTDSEERQKTHKLKKCVRIQVLTINKVMEKYFNHVAPNLISIDVEGLDFQILKMLDFKKYRPEVICIETVKFSPIKPEEKELDILPFMLDNDYFLFGDTFINSVFVDKTKWFSDQPILSV